MTSTRTLLAAGPLAVAMTFGLAADPAAAKCVKSDPIFGMKTYVDDQYCPKVRQPRAQRRAVKRQHLFRPTAGKPEVRELQTLLAGIGYNPGPVDGRDGPATEKAVNAFKSAVNLPTDASLADTIAVLKRISGK